MGSCSRPGGVLRSWYQTMPPTRSFWLTRKRNAASRFAVCAAFFSCHTPRFRSSSFICASESRISASVWPSSARYCIHCLRRRCASFMRSWVAFSSQRISGSFSTFRPWMTRAAPAVSPSASWLSIPCRMSSRCAATCQRSSDSAFWCSTTTSYPASSGVGTGGTKYPMPKGYSSRFTARKIPPNRMRKGMPTTAPATPGATATRMRNSISHAPNGPRRCPWHRHSPVAAPLRSWTGQPRRASASDAGNPFPGR